MRRDGVLRRARARVALLPTVKRLYAPIGDKPVPTNTWSCSITRARIT